jgi:hypothetical protein
MSKSKPFTSASASPNVCERRTTLWTPPARPGAATRSPYLDVVEDEDLFIKYCSTPTPLMPIANKPSIRPLTSFSAREASAVALNVPSAAVFAFVTASFLLEAVVCKTTAQCVVCRLIEHIGEWHRN